MPSPISPVTGTGLAGSLVYSSNFSAAAPGDLNESLPPASRNNERRAAFFGGQASNLRHSFLPVSNSHALGSFPSPSSLRACMKNGNSICSRKYSPVLEAKFRLPNLSAPPRDHPPCDQGPMTSVEAGALPSASIARNNLSV